MRTKINRYLLLVLLLFSFFQVHIYAQSTTTRGVWLWGRTLDSESSKTVVNKLKDNYINKVYLLVKGTAGIKISPAILKQFITDAHAEGMEVHLWYIVSEDSTYISANPDAVVYLAPKPGTNNKPYPRTGKVVNLLYPGYKDYVMDNIRYYLENFDCDGIHLDEMRYYNLVHSFDQYHLARADSLGINTQRLLNFFNENYDYYAPKGGVVDDGGFVNLYKSGDEDVTGWVNMRNNIVYDYFKSVKDLIQLVKPGIPLTAAFMAEASVTPEAADVYYAQNYSLHSPLIDEIMPMAYFLEYDEPTTWVKEVTEGAIKQVEPKYKISIGIQTYDGVTPEQVKEQIDYSWDGGSPGIVIFRYCSTTPEHWKVVKEMFKKMK
ncbi:MAG: family 10 glycosylhydrolase [Bacteroidota bacterium]